MLTENYISHVIMSEASMAKINSMTQSSSTIKEKDGDKKNGVETDTKEINSRHAIREGDSQNIDQYLLGVLEMIDSNSEAVCLSDMYIEEIIKGN